MLQTIREHIQGWIAWVMVVLISIPFALWGIQTYLGVGGEPVAAKVDGVEITERDLNRRAQEAEMELRQRLGAAYDPTMFGAGQLRSQVLDDMIRQVLLLEVSRRIGMRVSDTEVRDQILAESAFKRDGQFDRESYERLLRMQGLSPAQFEMQVRQQLIGQQLRRTILGSELVTRSERDDYHRLIGQKRDLAYVLLKSADYQTEDPVDEKAIQTYYAAHADRFRVEEMVKLDYLVLDVTELAKQSQISDEDLRRAYDEDQSRFGQAERRVVRHLLKSVPTGADDAAAQKVLAEVQALRERIQSGEPFEEVAKAESQDPGSASAGGSLGSIEQGVMDPAFDQAAFALSVGQISEPVRTRFGYHLIEVTEIIPASIKPFDEVKETLREELAKHRAEALYYDLGERLANAVYESPDSLAPAAEELGLQVQQSDWIGREGGEGILAQPRVMGAAFSEEVLVNRTNSDLIEPEPDVLRAIVLRVADHRESTTRPLAEVRDEVIEAVRLERAREATLKAAEQVAEQLRQGLAWSEVLHGATVERPGLVDRNHADLPAPVRTLAFKLTAPTEGAVIVGTTELDDTDVAVIQVLAVQDGEPPPADPASEKTSPVAESAMLAQLIGRDAYESMLDDIERRAKVERLAVPTSSSEL